MSNKDIIKYFYEVVVSENLLDELHKYCGAAAAGKHDGYSGDAG